MLLAQVTGLVGLRRAFDHFGLEPSRTMEGDDASVLNHLRFTEAAQVWRDRWASQDHVTEGEQALSADIELHHHFSSLVLNSLVLRGRSLDKIAEMPSSLRPMALTAVHAAHGILRHFLSFPTHRDDVAGLPLYLHSMIAYAVVFLMKMSSRWHTIGITIDPNSVTIPLIEQITSLLSDCEAGANHMVYRTAKGFERMLRQVKQTHMASGLAFGTLGTDDNRHIAATDVAHAHNGQTGGCSGLAVPIAQLHPEGNCHESLGQREISSAEHISPETIGAFGSWGFQDDQLWTVGMGYDLLAPGVQGLAAIDFPFDVNSWT
jgi:hypothetical protein